jgi:L-gulonolactone oxidase
MAERWTNWAGQQRCAPEAVVRPAEEEGVAAAVRDAGARGLRVRAVGAGHSFTDIACTDGVMVDLSAMDRVLEADAETGLARVQAGISINELGRALAERGLALENQGDIDRQAIAGALATATHGTGGDFGNISSRVTAARLVTGAGEAVELTEESDPEALRAARVSLGALGIVTELTIRCVPLFTLRRVDEPRPLDETLERLEQLVDGNDHFEFFAFPYADVALTRRCARTDEQPQPADERKVWLQETVLENWALDALCRVGRFAPAIITRLNRLISSTFSGSTKVDRSWRVYATRRSVRFTEMEYAIPRAAARAAVERVLELVERRRLPVNFPLEVRFAAGDDAFLSTANGRETCYVAVHQYVGMEYESYFRAVERIMDDYEGRPHWGKRHYQTAATLAPRYPEWDRFQAVRARLDPACLFANDYTDRTLGEVAAAVPASA